MALSNGLESLEPVKIWSIVIGGFVGIVLPLLSKAFPKYEPWIPSAAGIGLSWTFHWYYSLLFFVGAILGDGYARMSPKKAEEFTFPVASGIVAGGSLMGVILVFWENGPQMIEQLLRGWSVVK